MVTSSFLEERRSNSLPGLLIIGYLLTIPVQIPVGTWQFGPADLFIAAYVVTCLPHLRHVPAAWPVWFFALPPLFAFGVLVVVIRTDEITSYALFQKGLGLMVFLVTYACLVDFMRDWARIRLLLSVFVAAVTIHALIALVAQISVLLGGPTLPLLNEPLVGSRISGLLLDANAFGGLVALALVLHHLTVGTRAALVKGLWVWLVYPILGVTLLLTFSRGSWLGLAVALIVATLVGPGIGARAIIRLLVPAAIIVPLILVQIPNSMDLVQRPSQIAARVSIGEEAIHEFIQSPLTGMGLGGYLAKYTIQVHNTTLWFLSDFGVLGLVVFAGLLASVAARIIAARRKAPLEYRPMLVALLAGHMLMFGVSFGIEAFYQRQWWLVFAAAGAAFALTRHPALDESVATASDRRRSIQ